MTENPMHTGHTYRDDTPVPRTTYRCPSTARAKNREGRTHLCKITVDHEGDHACICGTTWTRSNA